MSVFFLVYLLSMHWILCRVALCDSTVPQSVWARSPKWSRSLISSAKARVTTRSVKTLWAHLHCFSTTPPTGWECRFVFGLYRTRSFCSCNARQSSCEKIISLELQISNQDLHGEIGSISTATKQVEQVRDNDDLFNDLFNRSATLHGHDPQPPQGVSSMRQQHRANVLWELRAVFPPINLLPFWSVNLAAP